MSHREPNALTDQAVAAYLHDHPDFLAHHPHLIDALRWNQSEQGAVSLVEIQLRRQREKIDALEQEIATLMSMAANNDRTFYEFMDLQEAILKCRDVKSVIAAIKAMAKQLNLRAYLGLLNQPQCHLSTEGWRNFSTNHLNGKTAYLGRLRKVDRESLFGEQFAPELGSYVVMPLHNVFPIGMLAFASEEGGHFQPHMDTLFLRHLSLVVAHLVHTLPWSVNHEYTDATPA